MGFAGGLQALIQRLDGRIPAEGCREAGGIERATHPIAAAAGTFMLGTKGKVTRAQSIGKEALGAEATI